LGGGKKKKGDYTRSSIAKYPVKGKENVQKAYGNKSVKDYCKTLPHCAHAQCQNHRIQKKRRPWGYPELIRAPWGKLH